MQNTNLTLAQVHTALLVALTGSATPTPAEITESGLAPVVAGLPAALATLPAAGSYSVFDTEGDTYAAAQALAAALPAAGQSIAHWGPTPENSDQHYATLYATPVGAVLALVIGSGLTSGSTVYVAQQ